MIKNHRPLQNTTQISFRRLQNIFWCTAKHRKGDAQMPVVRAQNSATSQSITDAISVLRHELLQHGEIYHGFKASLKSALIAYNSCGLPFEPEEEIAEKILDFMIGEEK